jgi:NodT family efflux transporter outer membrane factor (OMF) lipoprotein
VALIFSGCSFVPDYVRPAMSFGSTWNAAMPATVTANDSTVAKDWWTQFGDDTLNTLVAQALAQNNDLVAAAERIAQARGSLRVAGASLLPGVSAGASSDYSRADISGGGGGTTTNGANVTASYELDLFGANRASRSAAKAQLEAAGYDRDALALTTAGDVAQAYFNLSGVRERIALAQDTLASSQRILELLELRLKVGAVGLLDVTQQRTVVAQAQANLASLKELDVTYRNSLAILVGVAPQDFAVTGTDINKIAMPTVPLAPPATLLERRPDLKVAEANLRAANADIGAARAAFFPTTTLNAGLVQGFDPATTGLNLGASLLAPIFKGGANAGNLQVANARQRELAATYRQAVLVSFQDVGNALAALGSAQTRLASQRVAAENADTALRLAQLQLQAGSVDLPTLLTTQTSQLSARDAAVQAKVDGLNATVQLIRVMGGGWSEVN